MSLEKHGRGVIATLLVHADLIKRGYQVFTEDTGQGLIDLVAVHLETGETKYIDVKCLARREDGSRISRILKDTQKEFEEQTGLLIDIVYADVDTGIVEYPVSKKRQELEKAAA